MLETIVIDVDNEYVSPPKKPKKVVVHVNCKFQEIWIVKMSWAEPIYSEIGLIFAMRYCFCTIIERKEKKLVIKWESIEKHASKNKGCNGKWIMDPKCMHIKNEISYVQLSITTIFRQLNNHRAMEDNWNLV
jgi:hypothetical protein